MFGLSPNFPEKIWNRYSLWEEKSRRRVVSRWFSQRITQITCSYFHGQLMSKVNTFHRGLLKQCKINATSAQFAPHCHSSHPLNYLEEWYCRTVVISRENHLLFTELSPYCHTNHLPVTQNDFISHLSPVYQTFPDNSIELQQQGGK